MRQIIFIFLAILLGLVACIRRNSPRPGPGYEVQIDHAKIKSLIDAPNFSQDLVSAEPIAELRIPDYAMNWMFRRALLSINSPVHLLEDVVFSPVNQSITLSGTFNLPYSVLSSLVGMDERKKIEEKHTFSVTVTPNIRVLPDASYLRLEILSLRLNEKELVASFPIMANICSILLASSGFHNLFADRKKGSVKAGDMAGRDVTLRVHQFLAQKNVQFYEESRVISLKLKPGALVDLSMYAEEKQFSEFVGNLRIWAFSPITLAGSKRSGLYIAIGLGQPIEGKKGWEATYRTRINKDARQAFGYIKDEIAELGQPQPVFRQAEEELFELLFRFSLVPLSNLEDIKKETFLTGLAETINQTLNPQNPLFMINPRSEYDRLQKKIDRQMVFFVEDIKQQRKERQEAQEGIVSANRWPLVNKHLSQKALTQVVRYFKDIGINEEQIFKELNAQIVPTLPGFIISGFVKLDLAKLLDVNLLRESYEKYYVYQPFYGDAVPFSLSVRFLMQTDGWLRLEIDNLKLFAPQHQVTLTRSDKTGKLLFFLAEKLLTKTMLALVIEKDANLDPRLQAMKDKEDAAQVIASLISLKREFEGEKMMSGSMQDASQAVEQLIRKDITVNPFRSEGRKYISEKVNLAQYIRHDGNTMMIYFHPKIVSNYFFSDYPEVRIWNIEPIISLYDGRVKLELAAGVGNRSAVFNRHMQDRAGGVSNEKLALANGKETPVGEDLGVEIGLKDLTLQINALLAAAKNKFNQDVAAALKEEKEQKHVWVNDLSMSVKDKKALQLTLTMSIIEKEHRSIINPKRWLDSEMETSTEVMSVSTDFQLFLSDLKQLSASLPTYKNEVFFGDHLLILDFVRAKIKSTQYPVFEWILKHLGVVDLANLDFNSSGLDRLVRKMLFSMLKPVIDDVTRVEKTVVAGLAINKYFKFRFSNEQLMLQLNPRFLSASFELTPTGKKGSTSSSGHEITINPDLDTIRFSFHTKGGLTLADKSNLLTIMRQVSEKFELLLADPSTMVQQMKEMQFYESLFLSTSPNGQAARPGLFAAFMLLLNQYPELESMVGNLREWVQDFEWQLLRDFSIENWIIDKSVVEKNLTECGIELMYFAAVAFRFYSHLDALIENLDAQSLSEEALRRIRYYGFVMRRDEIYDRFLKPLIPTYQKLYAQKNMRIIRMGPTDWNQLFFPDAIFAQSLYNNIATFVKKK